jgi:hypothetical protein
MKTLDTVIIYSPIVILWWIALWNIFEHIINLISNKNDSVKMNIYYIIILLVLVILYNIPDSLEHF